MPLIVNNQFQAREDRVPRPRRGLIRFHALADGREITIAAAAFKGAVFMTLAEIERERKAAEEARAKAEAEAKQRSETEENAVRELLHAVKTGRLIIPGAKPRVTLPR